MTKPKPAYLRFALVGLIAFVSGCARFKSVHHEQPSFVTPQKAETQTISLQELNPLPPGVRQKLLSNIRAWKKELKQWAATAKVYNESVKERNEAARRAITE